MKRNFDTVIRDFDGQPLKRGDDDLTLKNVAIDALMAMYPEDTKISGEEKLLRYQLASRIHAGGDVELTAEEITKLKVLIGKGFAPAAVGPAYLLLETDADTSAPAQ